MSNIPIVSFSGGLITPHIDARIDAPQYQSACRVLNNFLARLYGSAERRPGTFYINDMWAYTDDLNVYPAYGVTTCLLVPFIYNRDTAYVLEFTNYYLRVYYGDAVVAKLDTTYAEADLFNLQFKQLGDTIRITHESYLPKILSRTSATVFAISDLAFDYGPFLKRNDLANPDNPNNITMTPNVSGLASGVVGSFTGNYWRLWRNTNGQNGVDGLNTTYVGGGSDESTNSAWIRFTATYAEAIDVDQLNINYICMSSSQPAGDLADNTYTQRGLKAYSSSPVVDGATAVVDGSTAIVDGYWTVIVDPTTESATFTATSYSDAPASLLGLNSNVSLKALGLKDVTKIEAYLYATNPTSHHRTVAVAIFDVSLGDQIGLETGTLTASGDYFDSQMVGALFYLLQPKVTTNATGYFAATQTNVDLTSQILTHGTFIVSIHTGWVGKISLQRKVGVNEYEVWETWNASTNTKAVQQSYVEDGRNVYYKLVVESLTSGSVQGEIELKETMQTGFCRVTAYTSATRVSIAVIAPFVAEVATTRWAEGAWSDYRGYPTSCCFIEDRCIYGGMKAIINQASGTANYLATIWLSGTGDYEDFDEGTNGADSFSVTIQSTANLQWVEAMDNLMIGTSDGIFIIRSSRMDAVMVPKPPPICRQVSAYPCDRVRPVKTMKTMVYLSGRQVRELAYDRGSYSSDNDLTALCEQITLSPITNLALQTNPDTILWCTHTNGDYSAFIYDRENEVMAWAKMPLALSGGGITPNIKSSCVIPNSGSGDSIYVAVNRTITGKTIVDGSTAVLDGTEVVVDKMYVIYLEKFAQRFE
jgi:hypothetical protein